MLAYKKVNAVRPANEPAGMLVIRLFQRVLSTALTVLPMRRTTHRCTFPSNGNTHRSVVAVGIPLGMAVSDLP